MGSQLLKLLDDLYVHGLEHDASQADRLDRLRNVEPDTARLLSVLIRALAPHSLLELGTSNGYSTIWLADAARAVGALLADDPAGSAISIDAEQRASGSRPDQRGVLKQARAEVGERVG